MTSIERRMVEDAPPPGGCYAHAVVHGGLIYCSGQLGVDPATGQFRDGAADQTRQALENLSTVLSAVGAGLSSVIQVRVFLRDFSDFAAMDAVFTEFFENHRPARTTIPCSGWPEHLAVEIDVIAADGPVPGGRTV
jgi:2-iminobutanoate/2-iminopropanoate deaminase